MHRDLLKPFIAGLLASVAFTGAANGQTYQCAKAGETRTLEILKPGVVGQACDLRYTYNNGATVKTPYHANNSTSFCADKARTLMAELAGSGFACSAGESVAAAPQGAVETVAALDQPAPPAQTAPPENTSLETTIREADGAQTEIDETVQTRTSDIAVAERAAAEPVSASEPAADNTGYTQDISDILVAENEPSHSDAAPAPQTQETPQAQEGPVALTSAAATVTTQARAPKTSAVGRLMGAEPEEPVEAPKSVTEPVRVAEAAVPTEHDAPEQRLAPAIQEASAQAAPAADAADNAPAPQKVRKLRPAPDIIRGVLSAQAAAWNEGDLEAFMAGYWKSPDLRFVSGTEVTGGWTQTLKRYKSRYGATGDLGQLSFKKLDVEMLTDDVAIVVGRFYLEKDDAEDSGVFTLVMKQFQGRWRIVHDHTVGEQKTASSEANG